MCDSSIGDSAVVFLNPLSLDVVQPSKAYRVATVAEVRRFDNHFLLQLMCRYAASEEVRKPILEKKIAKI